MTDKEIDELFVRKDLYDANSARLEALMRVTIVENRQSLAEHKAVVEGLRGDVRELNARLEVGLDAVNHRIDDVNTRIDDVNTKVSRSLTVMSVILSIVGLLFALPPVINALMPVIEKLIK